MAKKHQSLPPAEALRRTELITSLLAQDTWYALRARAALTTGNDVVWAQDFQKPSAWADTYNVLQNCTATTIALTLARLFDVSDTSKYPIEQQDKASVPVLAHLLMRPDVRDAIASKARKWSTDLINGAELGEATCREAMSAAWNLYDAHTKSKDQQDAIGRLREFRTSRLAHHLFDKIPTDLPRFDDLDLLADFAREFVRTSVLAVEGLDRDLSQQEEIKRGVEPAIRAGHYHGGASVPVDVLFGDVKTSTDRFQKAVEKMDIPDTCELAAENKFNGVIYPGSIDGSSNSITVDKKWITDQVANGSGFLVVKGCIVYETIKSMHKSRYCFFYNGKIAETRPAEHRNFLQSCPGEKENDAN